MTTEPRGGPCGVALKEWAGVCQALLDGRQTVLLRKGGIAEEDGRFGPEYPRFWLLPTAFHELEQGLRPGAGGSSNPLAPPPAGFVDLPGLGLLTDWAYLDHPEALSAMEGEHVLAEETVLRRFRYRRPGIWVLGLRVYRAPAPRRVVDRPEYAGCKSWVALDPPPATTGLVPVLEEAEAAERAGRLFGRIGGSAAAGRGRVP